MLCANLYLLFKQHKIHEEVANKNDLLSEQINRLSDEKLFLENDIISSMQGSCFLDPQMKLYTINGDSILLSNIKGKNNVLVLRYTALCCSSCVEDILNKMKKFTEENPRIDVMLLANYRIVFEEKTFKRICQIFPKVYNVDLLHIPLEENIVPYLFILDKEMRVVDTFIPRKELPLLTEAYFDKIKNNLKRSNI